MKLQASVKRKTQITNMEETEKHQQVIRLLAWNSGTGNSFTNSTSLLCTKKMRGIEGGVAILLQIRKKSWFGLPVT